MVDFEYLKNNINTAGLLGCDTAIGNLFILKDRYHINFAIGNNILFREYNYSESIKGFAYPLNICDNKDELFKYFFSYITNNSLKDKISLCLFTKEQTEAFDSFLKKEKLQYHIEWKTNPADSDYIYLQSDLELLPGKKLQKKKNHISKFNRTFQNPSFVFFDKTNCSSKIIDDFVQVAEKWVDEQEAKNQFSTADYFSELKSLKETIYNINVLDLFGGILYINDCPVAITLASKISNDVLDIHFEKCLSEAAAFGGYAVINNLFIKNLKEYKYINREEDLGIEGLKKAKLSYKPEIILEKYFGELIKN